MIGDGRLLNAREITACLQRLAKRKGKRVRLADVPSGALVRSDDGTLFHFTIDTSNAGDRGPKYSAFPAWSHYFGRLCIGGGGQLVDVADREVTLVARPDEIVQPDIESPFHSIATETPDGLYHPQNYVGPIPGQHFVTNALPGDGRRMTTVQGDCDCGLMKGQVRSYTGHISIGPENLKVAS